MSFPHSGTGPMSNRRPCDVCTCVSGIPVEEGTPAQELDGALVLPEARIALLLRQRGREGLQGRR